MESTENSEFNELSPFRVEASPDAAAEAGETKAATSTQAKRPRSQQTKSTGRNIADYSRDELIDTLLKGMGSKWWIREDAIRAAAHRLGFRRSGRQIRDAFKSAINGAIRRELLEYDGRSIRRKTKVT